MISTQQITKNPIADMLENNKSLIMKDWLNNVRAELSATKGKNDKEIKNHIEIFFVTLLEALRVPNWNETLIKNKDVSKEHSYQRFKLPNYTLDQIIGDYNIFRKVIFNYLASNASDLSMFDLKLINAFIDIGIEEAAAEFVKLALNERDESLRTLSIVNRIGQNLTSKLNIEEIVQFVTDVAADISDADFGVFFYSLKERNGKDFRYAVSGVTREMFSQFPNPCTLDVLKQTLESHGTIRSDDITHDPRFVEQSPFSKLPSELLPIKSYLGVCVFSKSSEVLGVLIFGHKEVGVFTKQDEEIIEGLAAHAGIAMDNAKLYQILQDSIKARDAFLSIASHELKTPLTSLTLQSQMRRRQLIKGNTEAFALEKLKLMFESDIKQLERLNHLIDDMLDISRMRLGRLSLKKERIDLSVLANEVVERFRPQLEEISKVVSFDSNGEVWIDADPYRLEQVIANLLTNAMKYGLGKPLKIKVQAKQQSKKAYFCISDKGMGININDQKRIFSRFERAVSPNDVSGLGLGLSIAKDIVEAHGGEIHLESEIGVGSTFTVELPLI
ncbi:MAG: GAF domain-containing protein [Bacteriovorax sp.]|nr:GAF domain-containing protein [Bacteriovorax sp.]